MSLNQRLADAIDLQMQAKQTAVAVLGPGVAGTILDVARRERIGLLAVATRGQGGIRRLTLGSVADKLVRAAEIPVLVIRPVKVSRRAR